jgi:hypothetical protein
MNDPAEDELLEFLGRNPKKRKQSLHGAPRPNKTEIARHTLVSPDAPAPRTQSLIAKRGVEPTEQALDAWAARVQGKPIIDVAHELGVSIELAKTLIREVHEAIRDDLRDQLEVNRQLDLERIDGLIRTFYSQARQGCVDSAAITIRALQHRAKLTGIEPLPDPSRNKEPQNVLIWLQAQLPRINQIVDALPHEMPPAAP